MVRRITALLVTLFFPLLSYATRPAYWDFMWLVNISTICRVQSDKYDETPLARSISLSAALDRKDQETKACLQRVTAIPDYVCAEVMNFNLERVEINGRALREKFELETIELEEVIQYIEKGRISPPPGPTCPAKSTASNSPADAKPLDNWVAVCRTDIKRDPMLYVGETEDRGTVTALMERAEAGEAGAQNNLGRRYGLGIGVKKDSVASANWYRRAADQGLAVAQANLAYMYLNGEGVEQDFEQSRQWAKMAADQGHFKGQLHLGHMYGLGKGVAPDGRQAERCYIAAAMQGNLPAQETLVRIYARGIGIPADRTRAIQWLQRVQEGRRTGRTWRDE